MNEEEIDRIITMEQWCDALGGEPEFAFIDLPKAPHEDWIPFCSTFCNVTFEKNECSGMMVDGVVVDCCLKCPWYEGVKK